MLITTNEDLSILGSVDLAGILISRFLNITQFPGLYGCSLVSADVSKIKLAYLFKFSLTFPNWIPKIRSKIIAARGPRNGTNQVIMGRADFAEFLLPTLKSSPQVKPFQQLLSPIPLLNITCKAVPLVWQLCSTLRWLHLYCLYFPSFDQFLSLKAFLINDQKPALISY